jgi:hypothetical protein
MSPIVNLDWLPMSPWIKAFNIGQPSSGIEVAEVLDVRGALFSPLKLSTHIDTLLCLPESL